MSANLELKHFVFVYGTLKRNEPNHHHMVQPPRGRGRFIGVGEVVGLLPLVVASRHNVHQYEKYVKPSYFTSF